MEPLPSEGAEKPVQEPQSDVNPPPLDQSAEGQAGQHPPPPLLPSIFPHELQNGLPEVLVYSRNPEGVVVAHPMLPQHKHLEEVIVAQQLCNYHKDTKGQFERYLRVLYRIHRRYTDMNEQISMLLEFLTGLLGSVPRFLAMPVTLLQFVEYGYVNSLANKLKVLYSKGRRRMSERHEFDGVRNALEKCISIVMDSSIEESKHHDRRQLSRRVLQSISSQFHVVSKRTVGYIKYHTLPENFEYERYDGLPFKFYVSFYVEGLLVERNEKPTPFAPHLLYCPILWDPSKEIYLISNHYLTLVERAYYNWQRKYLCIDVVRAGDRSDEVVFVSYFNRDFSTRKILGMLSLLRDKIYQFEIFEFLKVLFNQTGPFIKVPLSKGFCLRFYLGQRKEVANLTYITEFITILLVNLRPERRAQLDRYTLQQKLRSRMEEIFLSRYSADKVHVELTELSEEMHPLRREDELAPLFRKNDKSKIQARDFYRTIENQRS